MLKGMPHTEERSCELYSQVGVNGGDLNLLPSEKEMVIQEDLLQPIEGHHLSYTQVDR